MNISEFNGTFRKQLGYYNRTFLLGNYEYISGKATFQVVKEGKRYDFATLEEAIEKFNEVSKA